MPGASAVLDSRVMVLSDVIVELSLTVVRIIQASDTDSNANLEYTIPDVKCSDLSDTCDDWFAIDPEVSIQPPKR